MSGPFIPETDYVYPTKQDHHMISFKFANKVDLSGDYPFRDKSAGFKFCRFFHRIFVRLIVLPVTRIRYALKVEGKIDRQVAKDGLITVCNHVFMWDNLVVLCAGRGRNVEFPMWRTNMKNRMAKIYRYQGAIPVPNVALDGRQSLFRFMDALNEVVREKKWLHFYPETALWHYYVPIRRFKRTVFDIAVKNRRPIVPLGISYRPAKGIYKLFKKNEPNATIRIGEPVWPDFTKPEREAATELRDKVHLAMIKLCGIESEEQNEELMKLYNYRDYD